MNEQQNVHLVQQAYAAYRRGDLDAVLNMMAENAEWYVPGPAEIIPILGKRRGHHQIAEFFTKVAEMQDVELFEPREFFSGGNKVVVLGQYRWRVKSTGRIFSSDWVHVFTFEDGKVTGFQEYFDTDAAVKAHSASAG